MNRKIETNLVNLNVYDGDNSIYVVRIPTLKDSKKIKFFLDTNLPLGCSDREIEIAFLAYEKGYEDGFEKGKIKLQEQLRKLIGIID